MARGPFFTLVVGVVFILQGIQRAKTQQASRDRLVEDLLAGYNPVVPPYGRGGVETRIQLGLIKIRDVDIVAREIEIEASLLMKWEEYRLVWNPEDYDNIKSVELPKESVWVPDVTLLNALKHLEVISSGDVVRVSLDNVGSFTNYNMMYKPTLRMRFGCNLDELSSESSATCTMKFGSWMHTGDQIRLENAGDHIDLDDYTVHPSYDVLSTASEFKLDRALWYPKVTYSITLKGKDDSSV